MISTELPSGDALVSDHPPVPGDLESLHARLTSLFQRFGPTCGPIF
jgi:hypothetical protein